MREFLKGEDITVLKNGNILGGIISVETQKNSTVYGEIGRASCRERV